MFDKLEEVEQKFLELEHRLADPDLANRPGEFRRLSQEHAGLHPLVEQYRRHKDLQKEFRQNKELLEDRDAEISQMAKEEIKRLEPLLEKSTRDLQVLLLPRDPNDAKNVILELRAGAGGEEASLFVADLFRMYQRFCERQGWRVELLSANPTGLGGFKEIIANISGSNVFSRLKYESGVHRVQRVPDTEAQGRIHTSTVTVAIMAEAEEVDVTINPADLKIDVFRSSGAGGQSVNTTDSAVRITHLPTGTVVSCQDERSQHKNKERALKILRSRILEVERQKAAQAEADTRRAQVGTGDRSERIRTYNFPQGRLTDHRVGLTLYNLPEIMEGRVEDLLQSIQQFFQMEQLKQQGIVGGES